MIFPTDFADLRNPLSYVLPSLFMANNIRRCTGFNPSRISGSARSWIIYLE